MRVTLVYKMIKQVKIGIEKVTDVSGDMGNPDDKMLVI